MAIVTICGIYTYRSIRPTIERTIPARDRSSDPAQLSPEAQRTFLQKLDRVSSGVARANETGAHDALVHLFEQEELKSFLLSATAHASGTNAEGRLARRVQERWAAFLQLANQRLEGTPNLGPLSALRDRALNGTVLVSDSLAVEQLHHWFQEESSYRQQAIEDAASLMNGLRILGIGIEKEDGAYPPGSYRPPSSLPIEMPWGEFTPSWHHPWVRVSAASEIGTFSDWRSPQEAAAAAIRAAEANRPCAEIVGELVAVRSGWETVAHPGACYEVVAIEDLDEDGIYELILDWSDGGKLPNTEVYWLGHDVLVRIPTSEPFFGWAHFEDGRLVSIRNVFLEGEAACCPSLKAVSRWDYLPGRGFVLSECDTVPTGNPSP